MANFIGISGDFMQEKALKRRLNLALSVFGVVSFFIFILGCLCGYLWRTGSYWSALVTLFTLLVAIPVMRIFGKLFDQHLRLARVEENGADGERDFVKFLKDIPDTYTVICDLDFADSYGNIDHLVIGPTGVFAIDVKNWRGNVAPDGKGELLCNGKPTDKPQVRYFTRRAMELKERIEALTKIDPYVHCVFAFLHTHVDAKWGTTGAVHCIRAEQIADYVARARCAKPLTPAELARIVSAAKALKESIATPRQTP